MSRLTHFFTLVSTLVFLSTEAQIFPAIPQNWQRDIAFLQKELPARHPDLFQNLTKKDWDKSLETLAAGIAGKPDLEIALALQEIVARVGDPNTTFDLTPLLQQERFVPIGFGWYEGELRVSLSVKKFERLYGSKVLKINGLSPKQALEKMARFVPRDNETGFRSQAMQWMRFPAVFRRAGLSASDTLEIEAVDRREKTFTQKVHPLVLADDRSAMSPVQAMRDAPDVRYWPFKDLWALYTIENDSLLHIRYDRCLSREVALALGDSAMAEQLPEFQPFLDSVFLFLEKNSGYRLLFDLRFNGMGGGLADVQNLAKRLAETPAVNQKGRVFVATNNYTAGVATEAAQWLRQETNALTLGEETADRPNHFGDVRQLRLPNSGLTMRFSTRFVRILPKKDPESLKPDIEVPLRFEDFLVGKDPVAAFIKNFKN